MLLLAVVCHIFTVINVVFRVEFTPHFCQEINCAIPTTVEPLPPVSLWTPVVSLTWSSCLFDDGPKGLSMSRVGVSPSLELLVSFAGSFPSKELSLSRVGHSPSLALSISRVGYSPSLSLSISRVGDSPSLSLSISRNGALLSLDYFTSYVGYACPHFVVEEEDNKDDEEKDKDKEEDKDADVETSFFWISFATGSHMAEFALISVLCTLVVIKFLRLLHLIWSVSPWSRILSVSKAENDPLFIVSLMLVVSLLMWASIMLLIFTFVLSLSPATRCSFAVLASLILICVHLVIKHFRFIHQVWRSSSWPHLLRSPKMKKSEQPPMLLLLLYATYHFFFLFFIVALFFFDVYTLLFPLSKKALVSVSSFFVNNCPEA